VLGISIDEEGPVLQRHVAELANAAADLLDEKLVFQPEDILINDDYCGEDYGVMGALEKDAIYQFARNEGILLDPVYTGRAAGGMIDLVRKGYFRHDEKVMFWHTGGTPALFADSYQDLI
jgi:1-aminocyclopropane-1-carboxylate deaminase/D-cysteine desulfhydrase-like pyridoxal-dependent ACC family enzyme